MSDPNTVRILNLDGGGMRGYLSLNFLSKFIQLWGIDEGAIAKNFDVICGASVGGLLCIGLALGKKPSELLPFFSTQGPYIFTLGTSTGLPPVPPFPPSPSITPSSAFKVALMLTNTAFYSSSGYYKDSYGAGLLYKTVKDLCGTNTLQDLETNIIVPAYQNDTNGYVLFSNLSFPDFIGQNALASDVALSTAAPPAYLPSWTFSEHEYLDGGIFCNNPSEFGLTLGKMIKPNATRYCILSIGTGIGEIGFDPGGVPPPPAPLLFANDSVKANQFKLASEFVRTGQKGVGGPFDTIIKVWNLREIAMGGAQENPAKNLYLDSTYTTDDLFYYRFNPKLDTINYDTELDGSTTPTLNYYESLATSFFNSDIENIRTFLGHLTA